MVHRTVGWNRGHAPEYPPKRHPPVRGGPSCSRSRKAEPQQREPCDRRADRKRPRGERAREGGLLRVGRSLGPQLRPRRAETAQRGTGPDDLRSAVAPDEDVSPSWSGCEAEKLWLHEARTSAGEFRTAGAVVAHQLFQ